MIMIKHLFSWFSITIFQKSIIQISFDSWCLIILGSKHVVTNAMIQMIWRPALNIQHRTMPTLYPLIFLPVWIGMDQVITIIKSREVHCYTAPIAMSTYFPYLYMVPAHALVHSLKYIIKILVHIVDTSIDAWGGPSWVCERTHSCYAQHWPILIKFITRVAICHVSW